MSSETGERTGRFRLRVTVTIVVLIVGFAGLTLGNAVQGPRLLRVELNVAQTVERGGQRLIMHIDQPIDEVTPGSISVLPEMPVRLTSERGALTVRFETALRYATSYDVAIRVTSAATGARSVLTHTFRTPDPQVYLLRRAAPGTGPQAADEIVRSVVGGSDEVVERATRIQEYAVAGNSLATIVNDADGTGTLTIRAMDDPGSPRIVAGDAYISQLQSASVGGMFGFVVSPRGAGATSQTQLQIYDPADPRKLTGVLGFDGKPLEPQDWAFVPGTTSVIAQVEDATFYLIDPFNRNAARSLGAHLILLGFIHNSTTALFEDQGKYVTVDLVTGQTERIPPLLRTKTRRLTKLFPVAGEGRYVGLELNYQSDQISYRSVFVTDKTISPLYIPPAGGSIPTICLAPNGQYLAVQVVAKDAIPDGYPNLPGFVDTKTVFVDTQSGEATSPVAGAAASWCN